MYSHPLFSVSLLVEYFPNEVSLESELFLCLWNCKIPSALFIVGHLSGKCSAFSFTECCSTKGLFLVQPSRTILHI